MKAKYFTVKEVPLSNHCPECYSTQGLHLTFKQKFLETPFYKAISNDLKHHMACTNCNTEIFPVRWTEDIERVFEYHQRALVPKSATFKLTTLTFVLLVLMIILVVVLNVWLFNN